MKSKNETLRISIFFDCVPNVTFDKNKNSQLPTNSGIKVPNSEFLQTNIQRLFGNLQYQKDSSTKSVYIAGVTSDKAKSRILTVGRSDFDLYKANSKTQIAFNNLLEILEKFCLDHRHSSLSLKIDLFGFGKGAALARNFANLLNSDQNVKDKIIFVLQKNNNTLKEISFGFIGLFDSLNIDLGISATSSINLNLENIKAEAIFHLTAMHEFRENSPLLSVADYKHYATSKDLDDFGSSSNRISNTFEFAVPGSHADIGGGYNLFEDENCIINSKPKYTAAALTESIQNIINTNSLLASFLSSVKLEYNIFRGGYTAIHRRKNVYGHLQLLYARLMLDTAAKFGVPFNVSEFESNHTIPNELRYFYGKLTDSRDLLLNVKRFTSPLDALDPQLIQKYVHLPTSARTSIDRLKRSGKISVLSKAWKSGNSLSFLNSAAAM